MANNRMYLQCKHKECDGAIALAKFYPSGSFLGGEGPGWFVPNKDMAEKLNKFFQDHQHEYDKSLFGGWQYELAWQVVGDNTDPAEQVLNAISKINMDKLDKKS